MPPPFNRRDSGWGAASASAAAGFCAVAVVAQATGWSWPGLLATGVLAVAAIVVLLAVLLGRLPPDLDLRSPATASREPPPGVARLRVALKAEPLGWYRLDVLLNGRRVGQLRPGTAFVTAVAPGRHELSARVWVRRVNLRDQINALPGTDSDFVIQGSGSRVPQYAVERHGFQAALDTGGVVLVAPAITGPDLPAAAGPGHKAADAR